VCEGGWGWKGEGGRERGERGEGFVFHRHYVLCIVLKLW